MALPKLQREFMELMKNPIPVGTVSLTDNPLTWKLHLIGPEGSPYQGGIFIVEIQFNSQYPSIPPKLVFQTPIFHANISTNGAVCSSIFNDWRPTDSVATVLLAINNLMAKPNRDDPYQGRNMPQTDYDNQARDMTQRYAI